MIGYISMQQIPNQYREPRKGNFHRKVKSSGVANAETLVFIVYSVAFNK
jgi:hypothetical protein